MINSRKTATSVALRRAAELLIAAAVLVETHADESLLSVSWNDGFDKAENGLVELDLILYNASLQIQTVEEMVTMGVSEGLKDDGVINDSVIVPPYKVGSLRQLWPRPADNEEAPDELAHERIAPSPQAESDEPVPCKACDGVGDCHGTGSCWADHTCPACNGTGVQS